MVGRDVMNLPLDLRLLDPLDKESERQEVKEKERSPNHRAGGEARRRKCLIFFERERSNDGPGGGAIIETCTEGRPALHFLAICPRGLGRQC